MEIERIGHAFLTHASEVLGDTNTGLSGAQIVKHFNSYAIDFGVEIPITSSDFGEFGSKVPNKRTALLKNLEAFDSKQQFTIIKELCELPIFEGNEEANKLRQNLFRQYGKFASGNLYLEEHPPTGWERVDRSIDEMRSRLEIAENEEQFQAIGMLGRETLITIAQQVFDADKHPTLDGIEASPTDAKRMLQAFIKYELKDVSEKALKFSKAAVDLGNQLTHHRSATKTEAEICLIAISSVATIAKTLNENN